MRFAKFLTYLVLLAAENGGYDDISFPFEKRILEKFIRSLKSLQVCINHRKNFAGSI